MASTTQDRAPRQATRRSEASATRVRADASDGPDPELSASDSFDEDDARGLSAGLDDAPDPVGAMV